MYLCTQIESPERAIYPSVGQRPTKMNEQNLRPERATSQINNDFALSGRNRYIIFNVGRCPTLGYKRLSAFFNPTTELYN